jgi:hypothetical protein
MASKPPPLRRSSQQQLTAEPEVKSLPIDADGDGQKELEEWEDLEGLEEHSGLLRLFYSFGSCGVSLLIHLIGLLLLAYLTVPTYVRDVSAVVEAMFDPRNEDDPVEFELDTQIQISDTVTPTSVTSSPLAVAVVGAEGMVGVPQLDQQVLKEVAEAAEVSQISIDHPLAGAPGFSRLIEAVPDKEFKGDPRAIIDDYEQAMDRIAQELMWMMEKGPLLVIWLFDQSGSMKDDQQEIRERLNNVYLQLGIFGRTQSQYMETSIVSFGQGYVQHTRRPTSDRDEIRAAIARFPRTTPARNTCVRRSCGRSLRTANTPAGPIARWS